MNAKLLVPPTLLLALVLGCEANAPQQPTSYATVGVDMQRNTDGARQHNARGVRLLNAGDLAGAEKALKQALEMDMLFGPAHNNLGTVYYRQKKLYLAAWEYQYAAKLMPNKIEPKNNLGMVFEVVGRLEDAAQMYEQALQTESDNVEVTANLARVYVRSDRKDARTRQLLHYVVFKDTRPEWVAWARERLALMGQADGAATAPIPIER